jgi:proline iminopeptidase
MAPRWTHLPLARVPGEPFAPCQPFATHRLDVGDGHSLHVEEVGRPDGLPVLFLHGGPGSGCHAGHRQLFDPDVFRVILLDQRGAGQSTPFAELRHNTTWHLVADCEQLRQHLGLDAWLVLGGSWGSTLALAYAQTHPQAVLGLVLRGLFLTRPEEIKWFYQEGAHNVNPEAWVPYCSFIPPEERYDMVAAYYKRLTCDDEALRLEAAKRWSQWEADNLRLVPQPAADHWLTDAAVALARIECHYFVHDSFFTPETALLNPERCARLAGLPIELVHGRYDMICPLKNAWDVKQALPHANLTVVPAAGHASSEPGILTAQQQALQRLADNLCNA